MKSAWQEYWETTLQFLRIDCESQNPYILPASSVEMFRRIPEPGFLEGQSAVGHVTGSAVVSDRNGQFMLLIFHPKLKRWLQPGGHVDPGETPHESARRETFEECGLSNLLLQSEVPFDVDIHEIPAGKDPAHKHFDIRHHFVVDMPITEASSWTAELECRWVRITEISQYTNEESVLRLARKVQAWEIKNRSLAARSINSPL